MDPLIERRRSALTELLECSALELAVAGKDYHFVYTTTNEVYMVVTQDEADNLFLDLIEKEPHHVSIDAIKDYIPEVIDIDLVEKWKKNFHKEDYDEVVNTLLDIEDNREEFTQSICDSYEHKFFLSCDDKEDMVGEFNIYRVRGLFN